MGYSSASDGEIQESDEDRKATTTTTASRGQKIDRNDRPRSATSGSARPFHSDLETRKNGPDYDESRSGRAPGSADKGTQGLKRRYPDESAGGRDPYDSRRFKVHYEDSPRDGRDGYHDSSYGSSRSRYDDGRLHVRRSPDRGDVRRYESSRQSQASTAASTPQTSHPKSRPRGESMRSNASGVSSANDLPVKPNDLASKRNETDWSQTSEQHPSEPIDEAPVLDEAALIEQRRKRREALRAKRNRETPLIQKALNIATANVPIATADTSENTSRASTPEALSPSTPRPDSPGSPFAISVGDDNELANTTIKLSVDAEEGPSAADYDPNMDMAEDRRLAQPAQEHPAVEDARPRSAVVESNEISEEFDMFADDVEIDSPEETSKQREDDGIRAVGGVTGKQLDKSLLDDWDDPDGYYRIILGEIIDKRYQIQTNLGKGVFSAVVRALDTKTGQLVAIKVIRKQETMFRAGQKEIHTLQKIAEADPEDKRHVIRLDRHFMHKGHLCMVFEHLSINLREVLKKFGRDIGINIKAVRAYAQQMFLGLGLLRKCEILHADLKPDNVLVNENRSRLKIADLGSAFDIKDAEVTDLLVSRFYRAPELMLGIKGDYALDMWSIGCTLYELYTGRILFTGPTNNQMLKAIMECRGKIPNRVLKRAEFWDQHFDADGTFLSQEYDSVTRKDVTRRINIVRPVAAKELRARLFAIATDLSVADAKELNLFADLLDRCLAVDPMKRITPNEALRHGFINRAPISTTTAAANNAATIRNK